MLRKVIYEGEELYFMCLEDGTPRMHTLDPDTPSCLMTIDEFRTGSALLREGGARWLGIDNTVANDEGELIGVAEVTDEIIPSPTPTPDAMITALMSVIQVMPDEEGPAEPPPATRSLWLRGASQNGERQ